MFDGCTSLEKVFITGTGTYVLNLETSPNATIAAAEKEGEEKMTPIELSLEQKDRKVFRELDGIAFKITGGNFLKGRTLNAYKQTIRLDKVKLTMNGRLIADLND